MTQMLLRPSQQLVRRHAIPRSVIKEAFLYNPAHRAEMLASTAKLRRLFAELGLASGPYRRLWQVLGLWPSGRGEGDVPLGGQPTRP